MEARSIHYVIPGEPIAWKRPAGKQVRYDSQKDIKLMWGIYLRNQHSGPYFDGPIHLDILFAMTIPLRQPQKKRELQHGKYCIKAPDTSNMVKLIEDACETITYHNDCIIAKITAHKKYDLNPRTEFTLTELK